MKWFLTRLNDWLSEFLLALKGESTNSGHAVVRGRSGLEPEPARTQLPPQSPANWRR